MRRIFTLVAAAVMLAGTGFSAVAGGHLSSEKTIVSNAAEADNLTTLVAAVKAAGLVDALIPLGSGSCRFTSALRSRRRVRAVPECGNKLGADTRGQGAVTTTIGH